MLKTIGVIAIPALAIASALAESETVEWLTQTGALGLCALMIYQNFRERRIMAKELDRRWTHMVTILRCNTRAMNRLTRHLKAAQGPLTEDKT